MLKSVLEAIKEDVSYEQNAEIIEKRIRSLLDQTHLYVVGRCKDWIQKESSQLGRCMFGFGWEIQKDKLVEIQASQLLTELDDAEPRQEIKPEVFEIMNETCDPITFLKNREKAIWELRPQPGISLVMARRNLDGFNLVEFLTFADPREDVLDMIFTNCPSQQLTRLIAEAIYRLISSGFSNNNYQQFITRLTEQDVIELLNTRPEPDEETFLSRFIQLKPCDFPIRDTVLQQVLEKVTDQDKLVSLMHRQSGKTMYAVFENAITKKLVLKLDNEHYMKVLCYEKYRDFLHSLAVLNYPMQILLEKLTTEQKAQVLKLQVGKNHGYRNLLFNISGNTMAQIALLFDKNEDLLFDILLSDISPEDQEVMVTAKPCNVKRGLYCYLIYTADQSAHPSLLSETSQQSQAVNKIKKCLEEDYGVKGPLPTELPSFCKHDSLNLFERVTFWLCFCIPEASNAKTKEELLKRALQSNSKFSNYCLCFIVITDETLLNRYSVNVDKMVAERYSHLSDNDEKELKDLKWFIISCIEGNKTMVLQSILHQIFQDDRKAKILRDRPYVLWYALQRNTQNSFIEIVNFFKSNERLFKELVLINESTKNENALHIAATECRDKQYIESLFSALKPMSVTSLDHSERLIDKLLRAKGHNGHSVLQEALSTGHCSAEAIMKEFSSENIEQLFELLQVEDNHQNTAFHTAADQPSYVSMEILLNAIPEEYFERAHKMMLMKNTDHLNVLHISIKRRSGSFRTIVGFYKNKPLHFRQLVIDTHGNDDSPFHLAASVNTTLYVKMLIGCCQAPSKFEEQNKFNKSGKTAVSVAFHNRKFTNWEKMMILFSSAFIDNSSLAMTD